MGQKVNPIGFRIGLTKDWQSKWYAPKNKFGGQLIEDLKIREFVKKRLYFSGVAKVKIERITTALRVTIFTARPGLVIGRQGGAIDEFKKELEKMTKSEVFVEIQEVKPPELEAQLVAENIAQQLEKRASFKRVLKRSAQTVMNFNAIGVRIRISGRLGGAELSRAETIRLGKVPLHTLRADVDYGFAEARTTYGAIGCKVWICRSERIGERPAPKRPDSKRRTGGRPGGRPGGRSKSGAKTTKK
ncbi:MAG: 30S ribosomal protein S3 [Chlamydiae bacterium]|nr:MAG: 30S ribosomal protein S3 [Chlamydiota bacterium]